MADQNASARPGGQAKGGIAAQPGDPDTPAAAAQRSAKTDAAMAKAGFGDDVGGRLRGPNEKGGEQR